MVAVSGDLLFFAADAAKSLLGATRRLAGDGADAADMVTDGNEMKAQLSSDNIIYEDSRNG